MPGVLERPVAALPCLPARGWAFIAVFPTWQSLNGKKEESTYIGARFSPFPPSVPSVYAFPANPAPDFPAGFDEFRGITWTFAGVVDGA